MKTKWENPLDDLWILTVDGHCFGAVSINTLTNKFILLDMRTPPDLKLMSVVEYTFVEDAKMALEEYFEVFLRDEVYELRKTI